MGPRAKNRVALTLALAAAVTASADVVAADAPPTARAHARGRAEVVIDGRLDEAIWSEAPRVSDFVERTPVPRAMPPVSTSFRVLYDRDAVYVGVRCELAEGETPRAVELTRDSFGIYSDDAITLKFDVRHDQRNTAGFGVNPAGNRIDYVAIDNGRQFRREFDAVWQVATSVGPQAWYAEFRIPVAALGVSPVEGDRVVGLNVTRDHNHRRATYDWAHLPPEFGAVSALHYGDLVGIDDIASGRPLTLIPYALARAPGSGVSDFPNESSFAAGGDLRMRLGDDVWGEVTVLTDFAQVDLDDPVINFDRFPLFQPEKRPFFLTGLDVFEFGQSGSAQLFFSRRIGLDEDGDPVPMWGGAKVYGRQGPVGFGVLDVVTDDLLTNWSVGRLRLNLGDASYIGLMGTMRAVLEDGPSGMPSAQDGAGGVDLSVRLGQGSRIELTGFWAMSSNDRALLTPDEGEPVAEGRSDGMAAQASVRYRGEEWRPRAEVLWVEGGFDPSVGFVRRGDVLRSTVALQYLVRRTGDGVENVDTNVSATVDRSADGSEEVGEAGTVQLDVDWRSGFGAGARFIYDRDVVTSDFELFDRFPISEGTYQGPRVRFTVNRSSERNPSGSITYEGDASFFGGVRQSVSASLNVSMGPHLRLTGSGSASFIRLPGLESIRTATAASTLTVAPTTTLAMDAIFQLNNVAGVVVGLGRLRWRYLPGSDLFLVYREERGYGGNASQEAERRFTAKLTYRYDAML